jgi:hypothetical protein
MHGARTVSARIRAGVTQAGQPAVLVRSASVLAAVAVAARACRG